MISILSEGFLGKKLYAAMAAMRFAANPPMLLWRVCSITLIPLLPTQKARPRCCVVGLCRRVGQRSARSHYFMLRSKKWKMRLKRCVRVAPP